MYVAMSFLFSITLRMYSLCNIEALSQSVHEVQISFLKQRNSVWVLHQTPVPLEEEYPEFLLHLHGKTLSLILFDG